jgi:hypothetical protein
MPGTDEFGFGDDILNAWFPKGITMEILPVSIFLIAVFYHSYQRLLFSHNQEAVEVFDPTSGRHIRYETFYRRPVPYSKAVCETSWISFDDREEIAEDSPDSGSVAQHIDNDTEWSDVVEHRTSGVADILVTGEVSPPCIACLSHPITHSSPLRTPNVDPFYVLCRLQNIMEMRGASIVISAG